MSKLPAVRDLDPERRPWEKQPWESGVAFEAFALYRDLGLTRSITKAVEGYVESLPEGRRRKPDTVRTQWSQWSRAYRWVERVDAYDVHVDERMREQREGAMARSNRRYEAAAATLSSKVLARIAATERRDGIEPVSVNELDAVQLSKALLNLQRVERLATGQPTELVKGAFLISSRDVEEMSRDLVEGLMQFIPQERQPLAAQWVMAYAQGGSRGTS